MACTPRVGLPMDVTSRLFPWILLSSCFSISRLRNGPSWPGFSWLIRLGRETVAIYISTGFLKIRKATIACKSPTISLSASLAWRDFRRPGERSETGAASLRAERHCWSATPSSRKSTHSIARHVSQQEYAGGLADFPGVAGVQELTEVARTAFGDHVFDLLIHYVFVAREVVPGAEDSDGRRETRAKLHVREQEGVRGPRVVRVVDNQVGLSDAVAELHDFDVTIGFAADAFFWVFAEDEGLSMLELDDVLAAGFALSQREPRTVVKNVAVLQNLDEGGALVRGGVL